MKYRKGYKYQLAEDEIFYTNIYPNSDIKTQFIEFYMDGKLIVKSGYAWDGASGPTIDTKSSMRGALAHDALYQLMRHGLIPRAWRSLADNVMLKYLLKDKMCKLRALLWRKHVGAFADWATSPKHKKKVYEAPGDNVEKIINSIMLIVFSFLFKII